MDLIDVEEFLPAATTTWQPGDAFLAGGSYLFSEPQPQVRRLLDLHSFGWPPLTADPTGLTIAATCTLAELAEYRNPAWPATEVFAQACDALLGSRKVHRVATVGGNICLALPAGPMTALTAALDGIGTVWDPDGTVSRRAVADVVVAPGRTSLRPGQLLRSIRLPASALRSRLAFRQLALNDYGRSATLVIGRTNPSETTLTVTAATERPVVLRYRTPPSAKDAQRDLDNAVRTWHDDVHGSPHWRRAMSLRLIGEVVEELAP